MAEDQKDPAKALRAALTDKLHIDLRRNPVEVSFEEGDLVIEGTVDGIAPKKRALLMAMSLEGVTGVVDRLKVAQSSAMTDTEVRQHALRAISEEPTLNALDITVEVTEGVVDLEGTVPSLTHKRLAGVLAWLVPGSMDVINSLEVDPPEDDNEDEICDAVKLVLEKDRLVDAFKVRVAARDWVVTLDGTVSSEGEKAAAEKDAWYVWGVNEVKNNLSVG